MSEVEKVCPIVFRMHNYAPEVLAFVHPRAGKQFVKGTIAASEAPVDAAKRELWEESGLTMYSPIISLGQCEIGPDYQLWHFFAWQSSGLPEAWQHATSDDQGHIFAFFWHALVRPLDHNWHPIFHDAFEFFAPLLYENGRPGGG